MWKGKYGVVVYQRRHGGRQSDMQAELRFKRLDWGMYLRHRAGRYKKRWKKSDATKWKMEQTVFTAPYHTRRLDLMFSDETKRKRYFPDDPYEKYNQTSFEAHHTTKLKNLELIRTRGSDVYRFNPWKAHQSKHGTKYNKPAMDYYEPPGYLENIHSGNKGVYEAEFIPPVQVAPHFQRDAIEHKNRSKRKWRITLDLQNYYGILKPWHPVWKNIRKFM